MFGVLAGLLIVVILFVVGDKPNTYGSKLEEYIISKNPTNTADVEKLEREFQEKNSRSVI